MTAEDAPRSWRIGPNERFVTAVLISFVRLTSTQPLKSHQRCPSRVVAAGFVSMASALIAARSFRLIPRKGDHFALALRTPQHRSAFHKLGRIQIFTFVCVFI